MINNIKNSIFPNNIYLEVMEVGWNHSDEIMTLTPDHLLGAENAIIEIEKTVVNPILTKRFIDKLTYKELSEQLSISESKCKQLVNEQVDLIKADKTLKSYVIKGYNYTKKHL